MAGLVRGSKSVLQQLRSQLKSTSALAARSFATADAPAAAISQEEEQDPVLAAFHLQQSAYRQIIEGMQNIDVPLAGDSAAIRKYADEVEALKKKAGYPDAKEMVDAQLSQAMAQAGSYSQYLQIATAGKDLGDDQPIVDELIAAAEKAEEQSGDILTEDNEQGWSLYTKALGEIKSKYGMQDLDKVRQEAIYAMYETHVNELKETVIEATETAKARDHLQDVHVDLAQIKPKWEAA